MLQLKQTFSTKRVRSKDYEDKKNPRNAFGIYDGNVNGNSFCFCRRMPRTHRRNCYLHITPAICDICHQTYGARDLSNHDMQEVEGKDATCTETGYTAHRKCSRCDYIVGKNTILAGHTWNGGEQTKAPTCSATGVTTYTCEVCGETKTEDIPIDAIAHDYGDWTSNGDGTHNKTCSHNYAHTVTEYCDEDGVDGGCSECGYGATPGEPVECDHKNTARAYELNGDGTHDVICYECGETIGEPEKCSGGEATCIELAVCSTCEGEYGELSDEHKFTEYEWISDTQHHTICAYCGIVDEGSVADCTYDGEGRCTTCGRKKPNECKHGEDGEDVTWWYVPNDDGTHDVICDTCGTTTEKNVKCVYGNDNECDDCGYEKTTSSGGSSSSSGSSGSSSSSSSTTTKPAVDTKAETDKIAKAEEGSKVSVKIEGTTVPADYIKTAMESKATVVVDYGTYAWEISDVKTVKSVDLSINTNARYLVEQSALKGLKGDNSNVIDIAHDGNLGFKGTLKYNVRKANAGKYVNLYFYNTKTKKLELQGSTKIGSDGYVLLPFTHCSTYVLNITATPASNELFEDFSAGESATVVEDTLPAATNAPAATEAPATTDAAANPETGNSAAALMAIPMAIAAAAIISKKR